MSEKDELRRLREENRELKKKVHTLEKENRALPAEEPKVSAGYGENNYFSYLLIRIREKSFYSRVERLVRYFRNSMWVTRIFKYGLLIYQYLQAGAFVLLYTALFILIIPIFLSVSALTLIITLILRKHNADKLMEECPPDVQFLIVPDKDSFDPEKLRALADAEGNKGVLIISPYFLRKNGIAEGKRPMYVCYRREYGNVFIVRKYFFFYLRKRMRKSEKFRLNETILGG